MITEILFPIITFILGATIGGIFGFYKSSKILSNLFYEAVAKEGDGLTDDEVLEILSQFDKNKGNIKATIIPIDGHK